MLPTCALPAVDNSVLFRVILRCDRSQQQTFTARPQFRFRPDLVNLR